MEPVTPRLDGSTFFTMTQFLAVTNGNERDIVVKLGDENKFNPQFKTICFMQ